MEDPIRDDNPVDSLKHYLDCFTQLLLDGMVENNIIKKDKDALRPDEQAYSIVFDNPQVTSIDNLLSKSKEIILNFKLFKETIHAVGYALDIRKSKNSNILSHLKQNGAFPNTPIDQINAILKFIDITDQSLTSNDIIQDILTSVDHYNINFTQLINDTLQYFTYEKVRLIFTDNHFESILDEKKSINKQFDIVGLGKQKSHDILIDVKYRRRNISPFNKNMLFQYTDSLKKYDGLSNKENLFFIIVFSFEENNKFEEIKLRFRKSIEDIFPEFLERIILLPINIISLHEIGNELDQCVSEFNSKKRIVEILFRQNPYLIKDSEHYDATSAFIQSSSGSFATWVKVPPKAFFLQEPMNNRYIIGHDTQKGQFKVINGNKHRHANAWGFNISPNKYNTENEGPPTEVHWRLWLSNAKFENLNLNYPNWEETETRWHHFFVRWNHSKPIIELFQNGKLITSSSDYIKNWPNSYAGYVSIGNWPNHHKFHHLNMELFRTVLSQIYLSDSWLKNEISRNQPNFM